MSYFRVSVTKGIFNNYFIMFYYSLRLIKITLLQNEFEAFILRYTFINFRIKKDQKLQTGFRTPSPEAGRGDASVGRSDLRKPVLRWRLPAGHTVPAFTIISPLFTHRQCTWIKSPNVINMMLNLVIFLTWGKKQITIKFHFHKLCFVRAKNWTLSLKHNRRVLC